MRAFSPSDHRALISIDHAGVRPVRGGVLIIESIFGIPGVGQLAFASISTLDVPMITGTVLVAAVFMVVMNFVVDVAYTFIDPRVRLSRGS